MPRVYDPRWVNLARFAIPVDGNRHTLRWAMAHMTSETARHAGRADILREQLDGTTGR
jgi:hypothetical protein